jgi:hypothetical protein
MGGMGTASTTVSDCTVGTLVVDMFDAKSKNAKKLDKASEKLFKNFPPGAATK